MARVTRSTAAQAHVKQEPQQLSSPPRTPVPSRASKNVSTPKSKVKSESKDDLSTAANKRKRGSSDIKQEHDPEDLPHNLGATLPTPGAEHASDPAQFPSRKRVRSSRIKGEAPTPDIKSDNDDSPTKPTPKKTKKDNYGLTPGISPYPDYARPTPEECEEVVRLLEKVHGKVNVPKAIPPPSLDVAGCGEVPSVLDALVRTRLSANTTNKNSSTAFQGLVARFGTLKDGIGKGSVDWNAVRLAPQRDVFKAIERGGLADRKSKDIQAILQIAYEENQHQRAVLTNPDPSPDQPAELTKTSENIISLDHLHLLSTPDAIAKMLTFPGIGPKTASCVALFCLQRPSFAVDTHVFRLCQYLGWVPRTPRKGQPKVDRNTTYSHCDARIPDPLKYPLHYLLIRHGKTCPRCRAVTGQSSAGWDEGCPIEHLVRRHGAKKGGVSGKDRNKARADAVGEVGGVAEEKSIEADESDEELSDPPSDLDS